MEQYCLHEIIFHLNHQITRQEMDFGEDQTYDAGFESTFPDLRSKLPLMRDKPEIEQ